MGEKSNQPCQTVLGPGVYYWCSCGHTKTPPWCDGSHKELDGSYGPVEFEVSEESDVALCGCGMTRTPPYCDGSHKAVE